MENPTVKTVPHQPGELFRGAWWSVYLQNGRYEFNFLTGHIASYEKRIPITEEEAKQLIKEELDPQALLRAYGL